MEIIKETSTQLIIRDFPDFRGRLIFGLIFGFSYLLFGLAWVLINANSFFSAFLWGVLCVTPSVAVLSTILPTVNTFSFDKNLGYFQLKIWRLCKREEKEYLLKRIDAVEIQTRLGNDGETMLVICLILDEGRERVDLHSYVSNFRKSEQQAEAIAKFLEVRNYGLISLPK